MTAPVPQTDADRFLGAIGPSSIHDVAWLRQQKWRFLNALRKNPTDIDTRIALSFALAALGERDAAVREAEGAFSLRRLGSITSIVNLSSLSLNLGFPERARCLARDLLKLYDGQIGMNVRSLLHDICQENGDIELWQHLIRDEQSNNIVYKDDIFHLLSAHDALDAYAGHQRITLDILGNRLCVIATDLSYDDGSPLIGQRYYVVATNAERKALYRQLFEAKDAFFHKDGKPWSPLGGIVGAVLCSLPLEEDEAVA